MGRSGEASIEDSSTYVRLSLLLERCERGVSDMKSEPARTPCGAGLPTLQIDNQ
jgi:hypothetical protein